MQITDSISENLNNSDSKSDGIFKKFVDRSLKKNMQFYSFIFFFFFFFGEAEKWQNLL